MGNTCNFNPKFDQELSYCGIYHGLHATWLGLEESADALDQVRAGIFYSVVAEVTTEDPGRNVTLQLELPYD